MKKASLFSGIGGIDLAAHWAGMETVVFCEREPFPQSILKKHWPEIPIIDDVHDFTRRRLDELGIGTIDIISAGYPCQPFSAAGKRAGAEDDRHLWPQVKRILEEIRPRWFLGENVAGHISLGLDNVLADLEQLNYTAWPVVIPAAAVGATQRRDRVFIVANAKGITERGLSIGEGSEDTRLGICSKNVADSKSKRRRERRPESAGQQGELCAAGSSSSCENVADSTGERCGEAGRNRCGESEERIAGSGEIVADSESQRLGDGYDGANERPTDRKIHPSADTGGTEHSSHGTTESRVGRGIDELPARMDGNRLDADWFDDPDWNPLDALTEMVADYPQPAPQGMPQYEWEPPRVATGVKHRAGRLKALGNAVDPLQIYPFLAAIKQIDELLRKGDE